MIGGRGKFQHVLLLSVNRIQLFTIDSVDYTWYLEPLLVLGDTRVSAACVVFGLR